MGTETIEAARTLLVAVGGVTAAAAFVGLVVTILRHALSLFEGAQEADRAVGRAARIAGFVLCIGFLLGGDKKVLGVAEILLFNLFQCVSDRIE